MKKIPTKVVNKSPFELPSYATKGASGMDIRADFSRTYGLPATEFGEGGGYIKTLVEGENGKHAGSVILTPGARMIIPTGLFVALPEGWEGQLAPRSGNSYKIGLSCANGRGCIDSDYRGEVGVIVVNLSFSPIEISHGDRIAQLIVSETPQIEWVPVDELPETARGKNGFGSTGKH